MNFKEFLDEAKLNTKDTVDFLYADDKFMSKLKRFFTLNWVAPFEGTKRVGERALSKMGFNKEEIKVISDASYIATGEAIVKFGKARDGEPSKENFNGWMINLESPVSGGASEQSEEVKSFIKKRISELLKGKLK